MYKKVVDCIIRPPRMEYSLERDMPPAKFELEGKVCRREDFTVRNNNGEQLECSQYRPDTEEEGSAYPCVCYLHGNSGCRADANDVVALLLPLGVTVVALDFSGSGHSEGEYVTLGAKESRDLACLVSYLRESRKASTVALWGRSMGAATAVLYAKEDPSISALVLDSPFSSLVQVMRELCGKMVRLPQALAGWAIAMVRSSVRRRAGFDVSSLAIAEAAKSVFTPAILCHANQDDFVPPHHSDAVHDNLSGDKNIIKFEGDHNSPRPKFFYDSVSIFLQNCLMPGHEPVRPADAGLPSGAIPSWSWSPSGNPFTSPSDPPEALTEEEEESAAEFLASMGFSRELARETIRSFGDPNAATEALLEGNTRP